MVLYEYYSGMSALFPGSMGYLRIRGEEGVEVLGSLMKTVGESMKLFRNVCNNGFYFR